MGSPSLPRDAFPLVLGVLATSVVAGTLVIAGLKAGILPGTSPLVVLFAWGAFARRVSAGDGVRFLNVAQVAGSAGVAVCAGVVFTAPVVQILHADRGLPVPPVDVPTLMLLSLAGALMGYGFVGLGTRRFLTDPTLPAPEARACHTLIATAVARPGERPRLGTSLFLALAASFLAPLLAKIGLAAARVAIFTRGTGDPEGGAGRRFALELPFHPIYLGIGGLLTLPTALLVFSGALIRLIGDFAVAGIAPGTDLAARYPERSMRWLGGAAMTVAVAWSLYRFFGARVRVGAGDPLVVVSPRRRRWLGACIVLGALLLLGWLLAADGPTGFTFAMGGGVLACAALMAVLGAILSLQIGSSASPLSGTIFVTALVLSLIALATGRRELDDAILLTPLLVATCVAVCAANDSSQDYKTLQLCGIRVETGFLAQLLGLLAGCAVVPVVLAVAHRAYTLGSERLSAPQAKMFATLIDGLLLRSELPAHPILIGLAIGGLAVALDAAAARRGRHLPSMALAVGIYLPAYLGVGILIGALCRRSAERGGGQSHASILTAAGLVAGAAFCELAFGFLIAFGLEERRLAVVAARPVVRTLVSVAGIAALGALLHANSRRRAAPGGGSPGD
ncbi:MAG: OPT/YSL family transporter [Planctomycetota bacterium]